MTTTNIERWQVEPPAAAPPGAMTLAPPSIAAIAEVLEWASRTERSVLPWGAGSHMGPPSSAVTDIVLSTANLTRIVDWQPDDLTLVVEAGATVAAVEATLAERNQTAVAIEHAGPATIGGMVAAGASGYRRLRYGPMRDRILEVVLATGDGRVVTAGGRVVKNVTGYDIPRLACGSLGALGVIGQVCLKLWPVPEAAATLPVESASDFTQLYRPLALLETEDGFVAYVAGTGEEVAAQAAAVGVAPQPGLSWPEPLSAATRIELRVPAPLVADAVAQVRAAGASEFRAQHGVGLVRAAFDDGSDEVLGELRSWAENQGGVAVVIAAPDSEIDRWGTAPASAALQRRVKAAFDPIGVMVPGILPGDI